MSKVTMGTSNHYLFTRRVKKDLREEYEKLQKRYWQMSLYLTVSIGGNLLLLTGVLGVWYLLYSHGIPDFAFQSTPQPPR